MHIKTLSGLFFLPLLAACGSDPATPPATAAMSATPVVTGLDGVLDAVPSPDGKYVYFIDRDADGPRVAVAPFDGSGDADTLARPTEPRSLVLSLDGLAIFVADANGIVSLPSVGPDLSPVSGSEGYDPAGVDYALEGNAGVVYFSGTDPSDGMPGVFRVAAAGGEVEVLAKGDPFVEPSGVVVGSDGVVYVADRAAGSDGRGGVVRVDGDAELVADGFEAGTPAGIALTEDESTVLVSALDDTGHSIVLAVDADTLETARFNDGIAQNVGSGGLHRARGLATRSSHSEAPGGRVFAWCGVTSGTQGTVFKVTLN